MGTAVVGVVGVRGRRGVDWIAAESVEADALEGVGEDGRSDERMGRDMGNGFAWVGVSSSSEELRVGETSKKVAMLGPRVVTVTVILSQSRTYLNKCVVNANSKGVCCDLGIFWT